MTFTVELRCLHCGSQQLIEPSDPKPDATVTCGGCGRVNTLQALHEQIVKAGEKLIADELRDVLKR